MAGHPDAAPPIIVVMGISGSGKSTLARALAARLQWPFLEGDDLHPPANVERMSLGLPLRDADRIPWLTAVAARISAWHSAGIAGVVSCSALQRSYRDVLRRAAPNLRFVHLDIGPDEARRRVSDRTGHFMPTTLVESQLAALETPAQEPDVLVLDATLPTREMMALIISG